jgi:hypothetical protein
LRVEGLGFRVLDGPVPVSNLSASPAVAAAAATPPALPPAPPCLPSPPPRARVPGLHLVLDRVAPSGVTYSVEDGKQIVNIFSRLNNPMLFGPICMCF